MNKWVVGVVLSVADSYALVGVEGAGELVAVDDAEDAAVELDVDADVEVFPGVNLNAVWLGDEVAFQKDALGNSRVLDSGLDDVQCAVFQVVVDDALADAIVFVGVFDDGLLEVGAEVKDLKTIRKSSLRIIRHTLN